MTPETTEAMNESVRNGDQFPYTYFAMNDQDWISLGQWMQDVLRYVKQQKQVIDYYRETNARQSDIGNNPAVE